MLSWSSGLNCAARAVQLEMSARLIQNIPFKRKAFNHPIPIPITAKAKAFLLLIDIDCGLLRNGCMLVSCIERKQSNTIRSIHIFLS